MLKTDRLMLRTFQAADASTLARLAGKRRIADTTISVPHPYTVQQARQNIRRFQRDWRLRTGLHLAIGHRDSPNPLFGYMALRDIEVEHGIAELSFWIDEEQSGHGYITEAGTAVLQFAFKELRLNRVCAYHMVRNSASGRVLGKIGMRQEGCLRQRCRKWDIFEDVLLWAILRADHQRLAPVAGIAEDRESTSVPHQTSTHRVGNVSLPVDRVVAKSGGSPSTP